MREPSSVTADVRLPFLQQFSPKRSMLLPTGKAMEQLTEKRELGSKALSFLESTAAGATGPVVGRVCANVSTF